MPDRETILRRACLKCVDFCRQITYHREMSPYVEGLRTNYWIYTYNNFIDMAVLDWCHLFGSKSDDLHWVKVIGEKSGFKEHLLKELEMDEESWKSYWESVKDYRDKDVAHLEVRPSTTVPDMDKAILATGNYYNWIIGELKENPKYAPFLDNLFDYFDHMHVIAEKFITKNVQPLFEYVEE